MNDSRVLDDMVAWHAAMHFWTVGEWPTPEEVWQRICDHSFYEVPITLEEAKQGCIAACDSGEVDGIPTVVAMRHGEAFGDWLAPLAEGTWDFRISVGPAMMQTLANSPHFMRALTNNRRRSLVA